jgi:hypothetical protein
MAIAFKQAPPDPIDHELRQFVNSRRFGCDMTGRILHGLR